MIDFPGSCLLTVNTFHGRNDGTTICGAGERLDTSVMAWHFNEWQSVSEGVHCWLSYLSILSERTIRFLTLTKALIGDQCEYSLSAGLWLVKFYGLLHYVDQIKKFGSPLNYFGGWLFGVILEGQAQETKQENQWSPAKSPAWHFDFDLLTIVPAVWSC